MNTLKNSKRTPEQGPAPRGQEEHLEGLLRQDPEVAAAFIRSSYTRVLRGLLPPFVFEGDDPYFEIEAHFYGGEEAPQVALFVAYIQDHAAPDATLDERVLKALVAFTEGSPLGSLVDDICVNFLQWRRP